MRNPATLALNRLHFPVTTLGYGQRVGLWTQGCSIRCPGCVSRDTWIATRSHRVTLESVFSQLTAWLPAADGLTVSGGEPFDQPAALRALLAWVRPGFAGDVLVYSGYPWEMILRRAPWIQDLADVVISDPYRPRAGATLIWRGSDNQRAHLLTPRSRERYGNELDQQRWPEARALDVCLDGPSTWLAGIPRPGDLPRLRRALGRRGFLARTSAEPTALTCRA